MESKSRSNVTLLYMIMGVIFTTCLLVSNVVAAKMVQVGPWSLTAGIMIFPVTCILGDVITEVYGFSAMKRLIWLGFAMNLLMVIIFTLSIWWPAPVWFGGSEAFAATLGSTPRILAASLIAFLTGSWMNAVVLSKIKAKNEGKGSFGFRAIISTIVGQLLDSCIFITLAFVGVMPLSELPAMIILQVITKTGYEACILPVTNVVQRKVKELDGINAIDMGVSYSLFGGRNKVV